MRNLIVPVAILSLLSACALQETNTISLELRDPFEQVPETCTEQQKLAERAFREKWVAYLLEPAKTSIVRENDETSKSGSALLAPVGSHRIVLSEWTLTNRLASAFINCQKREGYIQARGGLADREDWYGPFKF